MTSLLPVIRLVSQTLLKNSIKQIRPTNHLRSLTIPCTMQTRHLSSKNRDNEDVGVESHEEKFNSEEKKYLDEIGREFVDMKVEDYETLYKDDESGEIKSFIENALSEYEYLKYNANGRVSSNIDIPAMKRCLQECPTAATREKYFEYLFKREMANRAESAKKLKDKEEKLKIREEKYTYYRSLHGDSRTGLLNDRDEMMYGLWHNTLFPRLPETLLKYGNNVWRLAQAAKYNTKIIYDFEFERYMAPYILRNLIDQMSAAVALNKSNYLEPFDIWFCNFKEGSMSMKYIDENDNFLNLFKSGLVTRKSDCFTNYFDKSRLVYLSSHAREPLERFGHNDDVYIIGAYNDKGHQLPLTYKKAVKLGIRCKSLPLDKYLAWNCGSKNLCVNHVTGVLLEFMANGGVWRDAFTKYIPKRKIKPTDIVIEEEMRRQIIMQKNSKKDRHGFKNDFEWN